ncbi:MAG TPA: protein YgfX [Spongiibacteraceae bacterium]|nr:protein YgfX [Spongiibacteraceae bacterium]
MSSSLTPAPLRVEIKPSIYFRIALICVASLALGAIFYAELTWPLRLLLIVTTLLYSGYCWMKQRQSGVLQWRSVWFWRCVDGRERTLNLQHSTVWPGLIVLVFRDAERKQKFILVLLPDSFVRGDGDDARRLRVHLNHFPVFTDDEVIGG